MTEDGEYRPIVDVSPSEMGGVGRPDDVTPACSPVPPILEEEGGGKGENGSVTSRSVESLSSYRSDMTVAACHSDVVAVKKRPVMHLVHTCRHHVYSSFHNNQKNPYQSDLTEYFQRVRSTAAAASTSWPKKSSCFRQINQILWFRFLARYLLLVRGKLTLEGQSVMGISLRMCMFLL